MTATDTDADRAAFLARIIAEPDEDTHRLVFADWLEEHGEPERAAFIRVQCELAAFDWSGCGGYYCQTYDTGNTMHVDCRGESLRLREQELLADPRHFVNWTPRVAHSGSMAGVRYETGGTVAFFGTGFDSATFRRGFVESLTCTAADWLAHGDAIRRAHPVTRVRLTTWPRVECSDDHLRTGYDVLAYRIDGAGGWLDVLTLCDRLAIAPARALRLDECVHGLFGVRHPGVTFDCPDRWPLTPNGTDLAPGPPPPL